MKLFNDQKKISVGYFEYESLIHINDNLLIRSLDNDFGCPSVSAIRDRLFQTYPVVRIEVAFDFIKKTDL